MGPIHSDSFIEDEDADGYFAAVSDPTASGRAGMRIFGFHLLMMVLFVTVILAIPAWLAAAANISRSASVVWRRIHLGPTGIELSPWYLRGPPEAGALVVGLGAGPWPMGLGAAVPDAEIPWTSVRDVALADEVLRIEHDGGVATVDVSALDDAVRQHLLDRIRDRWNRAVAGLIRSEAQDRSDLAALRKLQGRDSS